ncbi:MAG: alpha/beta hydrolase [Pirellulales bacterium]|nr:alpha/beta hydrolase [Pirellulales bacterium]
MRRNGATWVHVACWAVCVAVWVGCAAESDRPREQARDAGESSRPAGDLAVPDLAPPDAVPDGAMPDDPGLPAAMSASMPPVLMRDAPVDMGKPTAAPPESLSARQPMTAMAPTLIGPDGLPPSGNASEAASPQASARKMTASSPGLSPSMQVKSSAASGTAALSGRVAAPPADADGRIALDAALPRVAAAPPPMPAGEPARAAEASPEEEPAAATASESLPAATPESIEAQGYKLVKVYYGTDRKAIDVAPGGPLANVPWMAVTLCGGSASLVLLVVVLRGGRSRVLAGLLCLAAFATSASAICWANLTPNTKPAGAKIDLDYSNDRGELEVGTCEVSIPRTHQRGELESPSIIRLEFREDPMRHVVLMGVERKDEDGFYADLKERIAQCPRGEAFVFVHGYNVTFEKAARRTAQMAYDLGFEGAPIFYSWPSQGGLFDYTVDETNVVWTVPHLKEFLLSVARRTEAKRVHLIAHSMGNRALTAALGQLVTELKQEDMPLFHELVLTAPDIDADVFRRDIAPVITKTAQRVTLYASSNDEALAASKKLHGYPRAGDSGEGLVVLPGIDTIDVSDLDTSLLGHSYYGDNDTVLTDLAQLIEESKPPRLRSHLRAMALGSLEYWVFLARQVGLRTGATTQ